MIETAVRRLREAASEDDVDCDGLRAAVSDAGYRFRTPELDREDLSEAEFDEVATDNPAYVTNWNFWTRVAPDAPADRAYLRWLEGAEERSVPDRYDRLAEGVAREWGQLRLVAATKFGTSTTPTHRPRTWYATTTRSTHARSPSTTKTVATDR